VLDRYATWSVNLYPLRRDPHSGPRRAKRAKQAVLLFGAGPAIRARHAAPQHPGQCAPADIVNGSRLYGEQRTTGHGATGNLVGGVDLRRSQFWNASSDEDLKKVVSTGLPNAAMPPFTFSASELDAVVAYICSGLELNSRAAGNVLGAWQSTPLIVNGIMYGLGRAERARRHYPPGEGSAGISRAEPLTGSARARTFPFSAISGNNLVAFALRDRSRRERGRAAPAETDPRSLSLRRGVFPRESPRAPRPPRF